jgi:hypothetical protein
MTSNELTKIIDQEISTFSYAHPIDIACFVDHRITPKPIKLCADLEGKEWGDYLLITEHNGIDDSPYRAAFDLEHGEFVREITLNNGQAHCLGRYSSLEDMVDTFA